MHLSPNRPEFFDINPGQALVRYRNLTGLSENEVADKLGLSENYVQLIEWGLVNHVSTKTRWQIIKLLAEAN